MGANQVTHWTLAHMRDMNEADPLPGLGELKPRAEKEAPKPVRRSDGIVIAPDGKWSTDLPEPTEDAPAAPPPIIAQPTASDSVPPAEAEPGAHGFLGCRVRLLRPYFGADGTLMIGEGRMGRNQ